MRRRLTVLVAAFLFLAAVPPAAVAQSIKDLSFRPIDLTTTELIVAIVARIDDTGRVDGRYLQAVVDRGAGAILIATKDLDEAHPKRSGLLYEIIARAGIRRNAPSELLRLYDPAAYDLYYTPAGATRQVPIAIALSWKMPPAFLPQAVVRAAPAATLAWLNEQAAADQPRIELLIRVLDEWSRWIAQRHERQFVGRLPKVLVALSANDNITNDSSATRALLRCAGAVRAKDLTAFAVGCLDHSKAAVRSTA
ncbi:MAG: hypothetical protein IH991_18585, partial [Planctomycetes bacterium]|nr:hypothetical protein [Planctomycetota bacterium]